jgi:hypothetical protein
MLAPVQVVGFPQGLSRMRLYTTGRQGHRDEGTRGPGLGVEGGQGQGQGGPMAHLPHRCGCSPGAVRRACRWHADGSLLDAKALEGNPPYCRWLATGCPAYGPAYDMAGRRPALACPWRLARRLYGSRTTSTYLHGGGASSPPYRGGLPPPALGGAFFILLHRVGDPISVQCLFEG